MVDVDGVVVHAPDGRRWDADIESDLGIRPQDLQDRFFRAHFQDIVHGRADLFDRLAPALAEFAPHVAAQALVDYWFEKDGRLNLVLLDELARWRTAGYALHLATVQEHHRARHLWEKLALKDRFDAIHYAAELGCAKPDPAFWAAVQQRTGFAPSDLLLIDDSPRNVESAEVAGWAAVLWDGTEALSAVLGRAGLSLARS
ncbi:HAD-IA family hydrolase [Phenylobacterium sp.]|uniref:HAD family hydrolase n=1 Tax=Phenylobacterium sp. TaxID=1871053 RepID=UPI002E36985E|nr:HAD-IA family hydrolase [Phenylobacterium sp.]HEX2561651.1 HAD-IA family hydrolase [Phenylobacterium sp.]